MRRSLEEKRNKPGPPERKLSITLPQKGDFTFSPTFVFNTIGGSTITRDGGSHHARADVSPDEEEQDGDEDKQEEEEEEEAEEEEEPMKKKPCLQTYEYIESGQDLPDYLCQVDFVASRFFPQKRGYTKFYMEGGQVEDKKGLIKILNRTMRKKTGNVVRSTRNV